LWHASWRLHESPQNPLELKANCKKCLNIRVLLKGHRRHAHSYALLLGCLSLSNGYTSFLSLPWKCLTMVLKYSMYNYFWLLYLNPNMYFNSGFFLMAIVWRIEGSKPKYVSWHLTLLRISVDLRHVYPCTNHDF